MSKESILSKKREKFRQMGVPAPITENSMVQNTGDSRMSRLDAIKNGSKRGQMSQISNKGGGTPSFSGIPESRSKSKERPSPGKSVPLESFASTKGLDAETAAIMSMFGGSGRSRASLDKKYSIDSSGPSFNPAAALKKKAQEASSRSSNLNEKEDVEESRYLKHSQQGIQNNFDMDNMMKIMEEIARDTISEILDSYTKKQEDKNMFKKVKTKDGSNVIKIDENYYKLTPVNIKKS